MRNPFRYKDCDIEILLFSYVYDDWCEEDNTPTAIAFFEILTGKRLFPNNYLTSIKIDGEPYYIVVTVKEALEKIRSKFTEYGISIPQEIINSLLSYSTALTNDDAYLVFNETTALFSALETDDAPNGYLIVTPKLSNILLTFIGNYDLFYC